MFTEVLKNRKTASTKAVILHLDGDRKYSKRAQNYYISNNRAWPNVEKRTRFVQIRKL